MNKFVVALLLVLAVTAQARKEKKGKTNKKDLTAKQIEKIDADLPKFETVAEALTESNLTALATTVEVRADRAAVWG